LSWIFSFTASIVSAPVTSSVMVFPVSVFTKTWKSSSSSSSLTPQSSFFSLPDTFSFASVGPLNQTSPMT